MSKAIAAPRRGALEMVVASVSLGLLGPVASIAYTSGLEPTVFTAIRAAIGATILWAVVVLGGRPRVRLAGLPRREKRMLAAAVALNGFQNVFLFLAYSQMAVALVLIVFYLYPVIVTVASAATGRDRLTPLRVAALVGGDGRTRARGRSTGRARRERDTGRSRPGGPGIALPRGVLPGRPRGVPARAGRHGDLARAGGRVPDQRGRRAGNARPRRGRHLGHRPNGLGDDPDRRDDRRRVSQGPRDPRGARHRRQPSVADRPDRAGHGVVVAAVALGQTLEVREIVGGAAILVAAAIAQRREPEPIPPARTGRILLRP